MDDYLKIYEKFKDVKEVADYLDDVHTLRHYFRTQQFSAMLDHIRKLTIKYLTETVAWNTANPNAPQTVEQSYINAENFLRMQGAIIIVEKVANHCDRLSHEEAAFIAALGESAR